jgi:hypothetical protein
MTEKIQILFLSANPWTTGRILVDEEEREIFEKLQEGPYRNRFEVHRHAAIRPIDLQRLLRMHEPHIVHFSVHGSRKHKIILGGKPGRGKQVDRDGLVKVFALYRHHVRLVVLNACFTKAQALSLSEVIDYSVGASKGIGDKEGVAFAGAFYRALGFGKSVKVAFESAKAELALIRMPRTKGIDLFVRDGVEESDSFPSAHRRATSKTSGSRKRDSSQISEQRQKQISSPRRQTGAFSVGLIRKGGKNFRSSATSARKRKRVQRVGTNSMKDSVVRRVSVCSLCAYPTVTVTVFKVAVSDSKCCT